MPSCRAVFLTILVALAAAAPAAASERSEARRYAAAMQPLTLAPEEAEALVAGMEARSAHVAATCMPSVAAAAKRKSRRETLELLYGSHLAAESYRRMAAWMAEGDDRLAAVATRSTALRRGRAGRQVATDLLRGMSELAPKDFCATVTAWEARAFKGDPWEVKALVGLVFGVFAEIDKFESWERATKLLERHGATRAQRRAFSGETDWIDDLREPAKDPVLDLLMPGRDSSEGVGTRQPWALAG
jgi:hypothetical protein